MDLIDRQAVLDIVSGYAEQLNSYIGSPNDSEAYAYARGLILSIEINIKAAPAAQADLSEYSDRMRYAAYGLLPPTEPDLSEYSDKLWKAAYERGKAEAQPERKTGRWLPDNRPGGGFWVCSCCKFPSEAFAANVLYKFCPNCGARMED